MFANEAVFKRPAKMRRSQKTVKQKQRVGGEAVTGRKAAAMSA